MKKEGPMAYLDRIKDAEVGDVLQRWMHNFIKRSAAFGGLLDDCV